MHSVRATETFWVSDKIQIFSQPGIVGHSNYATVTFPFENQQSLREAEATPSRPFVSTISSEEFSICRAC